MNYDVATLTNAVNFHPVIVGKHCLMVTVLKEMELHTKLLTIFYDVILLLMAKASQTIVRRSRFRLVPLSVLNANSATSLNLLSSPK